MHLTGEFCARGSLKRTLIGSTALCVPLLLAAGAQAQDASGPTAAPAVEEVTVTGSRIVRKDYTSDTPTVTLSADQLTKSSQVSIDQQLAKLPQAVPGANQITSSTDTQATPTNSPGIATVNLRGLGSNRTLVLIDGRRTQPNNASLVVDLNTIPTEAIDNVEIITGGAAATYGADAVAGVVNFRLKDNYQGITLDAQWGQTEHGDGTQTRISSLMGVNLDDGRGNVMLSMTYAKRDPVVQRDRAFFRRAFTDPNTSQVYSFPNFAGFAGGGSQAAYNAVFGADGYPAGDVTAGTALYFNPGTTTADATLFTVMGGKVSGSTAPGYTGGLYPYYKVMSDGSLGSNAPDTYVSLPLTRYSVFSKGHYEVNRHLTFYGEANFDENETYTDLGQAAPAVNQWSVTVPYDSATNGVASGHPVPDALATILNSRANPNAPWQLNWMTDFMGDRGLRNLTYTYQVLGGVKGDVGIKDWTYDLYASHGRTSATATLTGIVDLARYQTLINQPNYGAGAVFQNGRIGLNSACTSGINPFVTTAVTKDCKSILDANLHTTTDLTQDIVELDFQGGLFDLPAGEVRFAAGADWRRDDFAYSPDAAMSTTNITSLSVGLFDTSPTSGSTAVSEGYGELLIPVIKDVPFVKAFNVDAGYRYSSYDTSGGVDTWKATADWSINDWIKVRGGYSVANRAPNVAELYQPPTYQTVQWPDHDPCSILTRATYGNVASNPNRAQVQALCSALAGGYPINSSYVGNQPFYFPLGRDLQEGNTNLKSETADTFTIGTVLKSPFENPLVANMTLTIDYYNIDLEGAIAPATTQITYQECFNAFGSNPSYDPNNPFCQLIIRDPKTGFWLATKAEYQNLGSIKTSGIDAQLDWTAPAPNVFGGDDGAVFATVAFNYLDAYDVQSLAGGPVLHYADSIGHDILTPPYGAQFKWKLYTTLGYNFGPGTLTLHWRHLPETRNFALVTSPTSTAVASASHDEFDLSGTWVFSPTYEVNVGIDNLFDAQPETVGYTPGVTNSAGVTDIAGSYDELGRSYYVALKARF